MYPWGNQRRYYSWTDAMRRRYGTRLQKLSVNAGFSCPNRDGTVGVGGCTFCDNDAFSPSYCRPDKSVTEQIDRGLRFIKKRYPRASLFVAYFQSFSNTWAPLGRLEEVYQEALAHPAVSGLVIGTRPDCVDADKLDYLAELSRTHIIKLEFGIESCNDHSLKRINRGHRFADSVKAIQMSAKRNLTTGAHMIFGLPGESRVQMLEQVHEINKLPIHTIKFHQLQIVKGTPMAREYAANPDDFALFDPEAYVAFVCEFIARLRPDIAIERLSGEVPPQYNAGKKWNGIRADRMIAMVEQALEEKQLHQGIWYG